MKRQTKGVSTKEQRDLARVEYALRLARRHNEGKAFFTEQGIEKLSRIIMKVK